MNTIRIGIASPSFPVTLNQVTIKRIERELLLGNAVEIIPIIPDETLNGMQTQSVIIEQN